MGDSDDTTPLQLEDEDVFVANLEDPAKKYAGMTKRVTSVPKTTAMAPMPEEEEYRPPEFLGSKVMWFGLMWVVVVVVIIIIAVAATRGGDDDDEATTMAPSMAATVVTMVPTVVGATMAPTTAVDMPVATTMSPTGPVVTTEPGATTSPVATTDSPVATTMSPTVGVVETTDAPTTSPVATVVTDAPTIATGAPTATPVAATDAPIAATGAPTIATGAPTETPPDVVTDAPVAADTPSPTTPATPGVSVTIPPAPTNPPTETPFNLTAVLPESSQQAIQNPTSPQAFALLFVNYDPNVATRSEEELVQRFALACLYFALGRNWNEGAVLPSQDSCLWFADTGSFCNADGQMEGLLLSDNNLEDGPIPPEIGLLTALQQVDMSNNTITGTIPTNFGELKMLETLNLANNVGLVGTVPTELEFITTLQALDLSGLPLLTGVVPEGLCATSTPTFDCSASLCGCDCACA